MEKQRRRAKRRSLADRKLNRVHRIVLSWSWVDRHREDDLIRLMARKRRDNMQLCSRPFCCGNRRRVRKNRLERLTLAELRFDDSSRDMTLELEDNDSVGSVNGNRNQATDGNTT